MSTHAKVRRQNSDELDNALHAISERWRGDLAGFLEALARARETAAEQREHDACDHAVTISRLANQR